jgi:hypothetical protein
MSTTNDVDEIPRDEIPIQQLTVQELKEELRERGLKVRDEMHLLVLIAA